MNNRFFLGKMGLFVVIVILEVAPMRVFIQWRATRRGEMPDTSRAAAFARTSAVQAALVVAMVFAATAMARGLVMN